MLTSRLYNEGRPEDGNVYKVAFGALNHKLALDIERTDVVVAPDTEYILGVNTHEESFSIRVTDDEMQEIMLAYLAVKKEIEEGQHGR